eukprot:GHUV01009570.1.p1 GENE.GHUV01009570.1~~GHUV01009570.1.p1  ORF type:complete len:244 (+),score=58.93 GHUV01009570.1:223-954(+)
MAAYSPSPFPPLLFTTPAEQPPIDATPKNLSSSISTARRSMTPPGSVHTDTTPPRPPPIMRLQDTLMADADAPSASTPPGPTGAAGLLSATAQQQPSSSMMPLESTSQSGDTWVTVFGFGPDDLPLVLREFQRCGDILQWGTFGASANSNFIHLQFQTKYAAQRALGKSGEQLSSTLIIGVKPLEPRHRQLVETYSSSSSSPGPRIRAQGPVRAYKVDITQTQALPQRSRTLVQKLSEFVLGI